MEAARLEVIIDGDNSGANRALDQTNQKVNRTASDFAVAGGIWTGIGLGIGKVTLGMIGTAADFEQQMSAVKSVTGASSEQMKIFEKDALSLGSSTTFSAMEVGQAQEIMAKAGVPVEKMTRKNQQAMLDLAAATGTDVPLATETAATAMNQFGADGTEVADIISQSVNASALDVNDWALALKSAGPVAAAVGMDVDDLAAYMMVLADNGIKGEVAATAMRNTLLSLSDTSSEATQVLDDLGIATYDAEGNFRGLDAITQDLVPHWKDMTQEQKLALAETIAGKDGVAAFMAVMNEQVEAVDNGTTAFEERKKAMQGVGTAEEQAKTRMDNFNGAMEEFKGAIETASIILGGVFLPILKTLVVFLTNALSAAIEWFVNLSPAMQKVVGGLLALSAAIPLVVGGFLLLKAALMTGFVQSFIAISAPILLVIAALAALGAAVYLAYKHFEPFRNAVDSVIGVLKNFGSYLKEVWTSGNVMNDAMKKLPKPLQELAKHVGRVVDAFADLKRAFDKDGIKGLLKALPEELAQLGKAFLEIGKIILDAIKDIDWGDVGDEIMDGFKDAFKALKKLAKPLTDRIRDEFRDIDIRSAFRALQSKLASAFTTILSFMADGMAMALNGIANALRSFNWGNIGAMAAQGLMAIVGAVVGLGVLIGSALIEAISNVDWGNLGSAIMNYLTAVFEALGAFIQGFGSTIGAAFMELFDAIDWGAVGDAVQQGLEAALDVLQQVGSWVLGKLGDVAGVVGSWFSSQISGVDWSGLFQTALSVLSAAGSWIVDKLGDAATAIGGWFMEQVDAVQWQSLFDLAISVLSNVGSWIVDKLGDAATAIGGWFMEQLGNVQWQSLFDLAISSLASAGAWIVDKLGDAATGIGGWFMEQVGNVQWQSLFDLAISVLSSAGTWIKDKIGSGLTLLVEFGRDVMKGLKTSLTANWTQVTSWLGDIKDKILAKFRGAKNWLVDVGKGIIGGIKDGITEGWGEVESFLTEKINGFIELINELIDAYNAIPGLPDLPNLNPIGESAENATEKVNGLAASIGKLQGEGLAHSAFVQWAEDIRGAGAEMEAFTAAAGEAMARYTVQTVPEGETPDPNRPIDPADNPMYPSSGSNNFLGSGSIFSAIRTETKKTSDFIRTETGTWGSVVGANSRRLSTAAMGGFMGVTSAASSGLAPVNGVISSTLGTAVGVAATALTGLGSTAGLQFAAVPLSASTNLAPVAGIIGATLGGATLAASAALLGMGMAASIQFAAVPTAATSSLGSLGSLVGGYAQAAALTAATGFNALRSSAQTQTAQAAASVASNTAAAAASAASNTASMAASVGKNAASMAANAIKSATSANSGVGMQMSAMQLGATLAASVMQMNASRSAASMASAVTASAAMAAAGMRSGMQQASNAVSSAASSWAGIVRSGGGSAAGAAAGIGANIGHSLAAGIRSAYGAVAAAADALVAQAERAMRAKAQIASPSKMTTYFGQMIGEGLAVGMYDMQRDVARAATELAGASLVEPLYAESASVNPFSRTVSTRPVQTVNNTTNVYQTNTYYVDVSDLDDLNMAVEFVKDLPRERELVFAE